MAQPAGGNPALILSGDVASLRGAIPSDLLSGQFVKSISAPTSGPHAGQLVVVLQDANSNEQTLAITFSGGMVTPTTPATAAVIWAASANPGEAAFGVPVAVDEAEVPAYPVSPPDPLYIVAWRSGATPADFTLTVGGTALISAVGLSTYSDFSIGGVAGRLSFYQTTPGFFAQLFAGQRAVFS